LELLIIPYDSTKVLKFIKAKNGNTFFFNEILGLDIDLPTYKTQLNRPEILNMKIGHNGIYNIYVGYKDNNLVVKTDSSPDLENLKSEVDEFIENLRDELKRHTKFNLIADKNISKYEIDSIKNIMKETSIKQIYRTYKTRHIYDVDTVWVQVKE
jgi:hypothetical protein